MSKAARQKAILDVLRKGPVSSQEDLQRAVNRLGFAVGQATLSRDIREMGLVKGGHGYTLPEAGQGPTLMPPSVFRLVQDFLLEIREAQNLLVLKTKVGSAQPVAAGLDAETWPEILGTIAGDDTVLVISSDAKSARRLAIRIREMLER
jgi:transcriptional regulator of arginine metabolism